VIYQNRGYELGRMLHRWKFESEDFARAHEARGEFRALLRERGLREEDVATCELVFGELVTNALKYGKEPVAVNARLNGPTVELEIEDSGKCFSLHPSREVSVDSVGGRGLFISSVLSWSLNVDKETDRCRVTATIPIKLVREPGKSASIGKWENGTAESGSGAEPTLGW